MSDVSEEDRELSFLEHLVELRGRLLKACLSVFVVLIALLPFSRKLYETLASPLMAQMPEGSTMIAIDVASPFLTPFKLTLLISIMISIPVVCINSGLLLPRHYSNTKKGWPGHCFYLQSFFFTPVALLLISSSFHWCLVF